MFAKNDLEIEFECKGIFKSKSGGGIYTKKKAFFTQKGRIALEYFVTTAAASSPTSTSSTGSTRPLPVATAPLSRCTASRRSASYFNSSPQRPGGTHHFEHVVGGAF